MPVQKYDTGTIPDPALLRQKIDALADRPAIDLLARCVQALIVAVSSPVRVTTARSVSDKTSIRVSDDLVKAGYTVRYEGNVILITIP